MKQQQRSSFIHLSW